MCVLANQNDLLNGILWNPDHYRDLVELELTSGFSFQQGRFLADIRPELLTEDQRERRARLRQTPEVRPTVTAKLTTLPVQMTLPW